MNLVTLSRPKTLELHEAIVNAIINHEVFENLKKPMLLTSWTWITWRIPIHNPREIKDQQTMTHLIELSIFSLCY
jgi:hypothetical protein